MKKLFVFALSVFTMGTACAQLKIGGKTLNTGKLINAATSVAAAYTITDADVAALCSESTTWMDANNTVSAPASDYTKRLGRLTNGITDVNGIPLNFKVYEVTDINAFASGDGSIRVFSALMDEMNDDQLMAIIGHEIGHVANGDIKDAMKQAYKIEAAKSALGSIDGSGLAKLTESQLSGLATAFLESKFSREQEFAADEYGMKVCMERGFDAYGMASSLEKLVELFESGGAQAGLLQKMFSSHPDSAVRAQRVRAMAQSLTGK